MVRGCSQADQRALSNDGREACKLATTTGAVHTPIDVDDDNECTIDVCSPASGARHLPVDVDDDNACTIDSCNPATGPVYVDVEIDDDDACTIDACSPTDGVSHLPVDFSDGDLCTTDSCDPAVGPVHVPVDFDDDDVCTVDSCDPDDGVSHLPVVVDDGIDCTVDFCDENGVGHDLDDGLCGPSEVCTSTGCVVRLVINELAPAGRNGDSDFVELKGTPHASLAGFALAVLDADGVVVDDDILPIADRVLDASGLILIEAALPDDDGALQLVGPGNVVADLVGWNTAIDAEGDTVLAPRSGSTTLSFARTDGADSDDNASDFHVDPTPTPGFDNDDVVPTIVSLSRNDAVSAGPVTVVVQTVDVADSDDEPIVVRFAGVDASCVVDDVDGELLVLTCIVPSSTTVARGDVVATSAALLDLPTATQPNAWRFTATGNDIPYCVIQHPQTTTTTVNVATQDLFGQYYHPQRSESAGFDASVFVDIGIVPVGGDGSVPDPQTSNAWRFSAAATNVQVGNNDEYKATFTSTTAGNFRARCIASRSTACTTATAIAAARRPSTSTTRCRSS